MVRRIGIVYCERIQDSSCVGCAKCYKAVAERSFAFAELDEAVQVVFKTGCGTARGWCCRS
jgi:predicted metal-binding protein